MRILGLSGSLRSDSSNSRLLALAHKIVGAEWSFFDLASLPYFDPDHQYSEQTPKPVQALRALAAQADRIFICTPEYAHGIPGILKNALEWMFHEGTQKTRVACVVGSSQGENTREQLLEILRTMDFAVEADDIILMKGLRAKLLADGTFKATVDADVFRKFCQHILK